MGKVPDCPKMPAPTVKDVQEHQLKDMMCGPVDHVYAICAAVCEGLERKKRLHLSALLQ